MGLALPKLELHWKGSASYEAFLVVPILEKLPSREIPKFLSWLNYIWMEFESNIFAGPKRGRPSTGFSKTNNIIASNKI